MAKKITAIVTLVFWVMMDLSFVFTGPSGALTPAGTVLFIVGILGGIAGLIALAAMDLIDYTRRPR